MIDIQVIRNDSNHVVNQLKNRGISFDLNKFNDLDDQFRLLQQKKQDLETKRNQLSKEIGAYKKQKKDTTEVFKNVEEVNQNLKNVSNKFNEIKHQLETFLAKIPNLYHPSVPIGAGENENKIIKVVNKDNCKPSQFDHVSIGEKLSGINFEVAS